MSTEKALRELVGDDDCRKILTRINPSFGFVSHKLRKFQKSGAGFLSEHFMLQIRFKTEGGVQERSFFVKALPIFNTTQRAYVENSNIFAKEMILYQELLPQLLKIAKFAPKPFLVKSNCIILEDLRVLGYRMLNREKFLPEDHIRNLFRTLAQFHASTIILEETKGLRLGDSYQREIQETTFSFKPGEPRQRWLTSTGACVLNLLKLQAQGEVLAKFHTFLFEEMPRCIAPSSCYRNVFTNDDLWANNMLFNAERECLFVDFQLGRYSPPGFEFLVTAMLNLPFSVLETPSLSDFYYECLRNELRGYGLEDVLAKAEFEETLTVYKLPALVEAALYGTHVYMTGAVLDKMEEDVELYKDFSFVNRSKYALEEYQNEGAFRFRMDNVLRPLIDALRELP